MKITPVFTRITLGNVRSGFTLVELLVTITIIIVLASLVFVVTGRVRGQAQQSRAMGALRQIGAANVGYCSDNNGAINVIRDAGEWGSGYEGPGSLFASNSFMGRMQPYLFAGTETKNEKTLKMEIESGLSELFGTTEISSMAGTAFNGVPVYKDGSGIPNPIAVNLHLRPEWRATPMRVSHFGDPSRVLYLTYGRYYFDVPQGSVYTPMPLPGDRRRAIYYLPNRQAVMCFLDGHVEMVSPPMAERLFE